MEREKMLNLEPPRYGQEDLSSSRKAVPTPVHLQVSFFFPGCRVLRLTPSQPALSSSFISLPPFHPHSGSRLEPGTRPESH